MDVSDTDGPWGLELALLLEVQDVTYMMLMSGPDNIGDNIRTGTH